MEEIKFRGKPMMTKRELHELNIKHENGWVYGNLVISDHAYFITGGFAEVNNEYAALDFWIRIDKESVGQYIGLKDIDGRQIFSGHVLEFEDMGEEGYEYREGYDFNNRAVVCFEDGRFELEKFITNNSAVLDDMNSQTHEEFAIVFANSRIIGSIYDNPELLEAIE